MSKGEERRCIQRRRETMEKGRKRLKGKGGKEVKEGVYVTEYR